MKRVLIVLLLLTIAVSAFAQAPAKQAWVKSYNDDMQINIYASVGWWLGITASAGVELCISEFNFGGVLIDWGIEVRGVFQNWSVGTVGVTYLGGAPLFTLHLGLESVPIEFYIGAGVGIYGHIFSGATSLAGYNDFGVGFATIDGVIWHFTDNFGLILEFGYVGYVTIWGIGIEFQF